MKLIQLQSAAFIASVVAVLCAVVLTGCNKTTEAEAAEPTVPPHQASAATLVDRINVLQTSDPVRVDDVLDLMYAENDHQRKLISTTRDLLTYIKMEQAAWERFGRTFFDVATDGAPLGPEAPLEIVEHDGARAQATYTDGDSDMIVYLVKIGDTWWMSGYTLEYGDLFEDDVEMEFAAQFARAFREPAQRLRRQINRGDFATFAEAQRALGREMQNLEGAFRP